MRPCCPLTPPPPARVPRHRLGWAWPGALARAWPLPGALLALLAVAVLLIAGGCAGEALLTKQDYAGSRQALERGRPEQAFAALPSGEAGTFITEMERAWLHLAQGIPAIDGLRPYRERFVDRVRIHVTREVESFFFVDTPEGYYPSEHEILWMHLLLSWGYSLRGEREKGCVEARQASHLLTATWSEEGHFDDPLLRVVLAVMWAQCGSWEDAAVDFRAAARLDPTLAWAQALGARDAPPRALYLVLSGAGPEPVWNPQLQVNPLRGIRNLAFRAPGPPPAAVHVPGAAVLTLAPTPGAAPWYARHLVRENALNEVIGDYRYGLGAAYEASLHGAKRTGAVALWAGATVAGAVGGVAVAYLALEAGSAEGLYVAVALPFAGYAWGQRQHNAIVRDSNRRLAQETDPANFYRFVRFLPERAWIGWSDDAPDFQGRAPTALITAAAPTAAPTAAPSSGQGMPVPVPLRAGGPGPAAQVYIGYAPGTPPAAPTRPPARSRTGAVR